MSCKYGSSKENYTFLRNAHYYGNLIPGFQIDTLEPKREKICASFLNDIGFSENKSVKEMCENFIYMYNYLNKIHEKRETVKTITEEDCHFMNYWLNVNLKKNNIDASISVNKFYEKLKSMDRTFFSSTTQLENCLHVIDSGNLENMEILYELYDTKQKITDIMFNLDITEDKKKLCQQYLEKCHDKYIEGMNNCLNGCDEFCKAINDFERGYNSLIENETDKSGMCKSNEYFQLLDYDSFLEKQRRIMTIKILSSPLILSFVIPLLYKYTPFGPFLREKINMVKNRWMNHDNNGNELLLSSTDVEDNISDYEEYNISYYSETN
ncbi:PIR Superfamily Protein [Plasmodium ovale wallikeri]|uniref:PIR Superfamily Protein n=1 Tax=Plasmodium ovale wallikeri TaxID=864142 RepID=A0A1A9AR61_PLAOA|nr:PIR Superfamily Protein [Plasmodium ovale wallikeri]SBT58614.1 PIR Superfamily Protein [Plasmodium ovale wallikeri]